MDGMDTANTMDTEVQESFGIIWQFKKMLDDQKLKKKPFLIFKKSFGVSILDEALRELEYCKNVAQLSLTFEDNVKQRIVNITANVTGYGNNYAKSILKELKKAEKIESSAHKKPGVVFKEVMGTLAGGGQKAKVIEPFIIEYLDLKEINHNDSVEDQTLVHHGPIFEVNSKFSCSSIAKDPPGFYSIHSHVKGAPVLFVFLSPSSKCEEAEKDMEKLLECERTDCKKKFHSTFLVKPQSKIFKPILLREGQSVAIAPDFFYQKISLDKNLIVKQLGQWDDERLTELQQWPVDCNCNFISLKSCGLCFTPDMIEKISDFLNTLESERKEENGVGDRYEENRSNESSGSTEELINDPSCRTDIVSSHQVIEDEDEDGTSITERRHMDQRTETAVDSSREQCEHEPLNEEEYQNDELEVPLQVTQEEHELIVQDSGLHSAVTELMHLSCRTKLISLIEIPKYIKNQYFNLVPKMKEGGKLMTKDHFKAAHYTFNRIGPKSIINIGGRCGMITRNGQMCDHETGKLPDLYRHIRTMHLATHADGTMTCRVENAVKRGIAVMSKRLTATDGETQKVKCSIAEEQSGSSKQHDGEEKRRYPKRAKRK